MTKKAPPTQEATLLPPTETAEPTPAPQPQRTENVAMTTAPTQQLAAPTAGLDMQAMMKMAVEKGVEGVAILERLMDLQERMETKQAEREFNMAMADFQRDAPRIVKSREVLGKTQQHLYNFAPIEDIIEETKELREQHGFTYAFDSETANNQVTAICIISHRGGHSKSFRFSAPAIAASPAMSAMQAHGSARSFAERYAYKGAFGLVTVDEDDDAEGTKPKTGARAELERRRAMRAAIPQNDPDEPTGITHIEPTITPALQDFLTKIGDAGTVDDLNNCVREYNEMADKQARIIAKRSISNRAARLGFTWATDRYIKP